MSSKAMEFGSLDTASEDDEDFMFDKRKKDIGRSKKSKGGPLFRIADKKEKALGFGDPHSPSGLKHKQGHSVHGVVGPADYIFDQSSPPANGPSPLQLPPSPTVVGSKLPAAPSLSLPSGSVVSQWTSGVPAVPLSQFNKVAPNYSPQRNPVPTYVALPPQQHVFAQPLLSQAAVGLPNVEWPRPTPAVGMSSQVERQQPIAPADRILHQPYVVPPQSPGLGQPQVPSISLIEAHALQKQTLLAQAISGGSLPAQSLVQDAAYVRPPGLQQDVVLQSHLQTRSYRSGDDTFETAFTPVEPTTGEMYQRDSGAIVSPPLSPSFEKPSSDDLWRGAQIPVAQLQTPVKEDDELGWHAEFPESSTPADRAHETFAAEYTPTPRKKSHGAESLAESIPESVSSVDSEAEENVWRISDEQREYYVAQFLKIQPSEVGLIKGQQARDFFLKSGLPTETLSKIWQMSDLNKDYALNLEEFCIAMHLVVAVKHNVELPASLPQSMLPKSDVDPFDVPLAIPTGHSGAAPISIAPSYVPLSVRSPSVEESGETSDEEPAEHDDLKDSGWQASFHQSSDVPDVPGQASPRTSMHSVQVGGSAVASANDRHLHGPASHSADREQYTKLGSNPALASVAPVGKAADIQVTFPTTAHLAASPLHGSASATASVQSSSSSAAANQHTPLSQQSSIKIARPRASGTTSINIMDASPWQLLPPPTAKGKQVKKALIPGPEPIPSPLPASDDDAPTDTLVNISHPEMAADKGLEAGVVPLPSDDSSDAEEDRFHIKRDSLNSSGHFDAAFSRVLKEKSRSIDSLASEKSVELRQTSSRRGRPRSYTGDSLLAVGSEPSKLAEFSAPPVPPPRPQGTRGHHRAASLDLNKLLSATDPSTNRERKAAARPPKPPRSGILREVKSDSAHAHSPSIDATGHRRSFSYEPEVALRVAGSRLSGSEVPASVNVEGSTYAGSIEPGSIAKGLDHPVEAVMKVSFNEEVEQIGKKPLEERMRKHELQSRIRTLRERNVTLSSVNHELDLEWKDILQARTSLQVRIEHLLQ